MCSVKSLNQYIKRALQITGCLILLINALSPLPAQQLTTFGRNNIQYDDFNFKILKTDHFNIYNYLDEPEIIREIGLLFEKWYIKYATLLDYSFSSPQPVILYNNHPDFQQTNIIDSLIPQTTLGFTESLANRIVLPLTGYHQSNEHVMAHELVHAFLFRMQSAVSPGGRGGQVPLWFLEGMSEFFSLGEQDVITAMWLRDAVLYEEVPSLQALSRTAEYSPYRFGHGVWAYFTGRYGKERIRPLIDAIMQYPQDTAFQRVFGINTSTLSENWQEAVREKYRPLISGREKAATAGRKLITGEFGINIAPALSPDGKYLAFFSQQTIFSIDLYLADAQTGRVIKKLASNNTNEHFNALRFSDSAGAWSPDSRYFAYIVYAQGDNRITVTDIATLQVTEVFPVPEVDAIHGIDWSPDGEKFIFSGLKYGVTNLYEYHLQGKKLTQLTDDRYAVLHPSWSPDGATIVFATDRQTEPEEARYGPMKIAFFRRADQSIRLLWLAEEVNHLNPQFAPDGQSLYFTSDAEGPVDLYRYDMQTENFYKLTNLVTGITGFSLFTPALSVAKATGRMAYSIFEKRAYHIYTLAAERREGDLYEHDPQQRLAHITLPAWDIQPEQFLDPVEEPLRLAELPPFNSENYAPLSHLVNRTLLLGTLTANETGTDLLLGSNVRVEDMLSDHELLLSVVFSTDISDIAFSLLYRYLRERTDLGIQFSHTPLNFIETGSGDEEELESSRLFQENIELLIQHPLSLNRRLEVSVGYSFIHNDDVQNLTDVTLPLHLSENSLAYVGDYSFFGFTSPIAGLRYRFEAEQTIGSLFFTTLRADYRHYFFFNPFTLAFQAAHFGRYFTDAESALLVPFFLGNPDFVRGYAVSAMDTADCPPGQTLAECDRFQKLFGSRIFLFKTELRLPVFGNSELGLVDFPFLPLTLVGFFDAGLAWTQEAGPVWELARATDLRVPVFSTGVALRLNLAGLFILQFYVAYPFQSPAEGLQYNLVIGPGW